jgi:hypothetical protein
MRNLNIGSPIVLHKRFTPRRSNYECHGLFQSYPTREQGSRDEISLYMGTLKKMLLSFASLVVGLVAVELGLRCSGYHPYELPEFKFISRPAHCFGKDSLGLVLIPGEFVVDINGLVHRVTHGADSLRITSFSHGRDSSGSAIYIYGCSYTYGQGVNDEETYPFLLQQKLPEYDVFNYSIPGHGTVQAYLRLKQKLQEGKRPRMVILNYATFHEERNVLSRSYRYKTYQGFQVVNSQWNKNVNWEKLVYPRVLLTRDSFEFESVRVIQDFRPFPLRECSALSNLMERSITFADWNHGSDLASSKVLLKYMDRLCSRHNVEFLVAEVGGDDKAGIMAEFCKEENIRYVSLSPAFSSGGYRNQPFDDHPNARAHEHYAQSLNAYLKKCLKD